MSEHDVMSIFVMSRKPRKIHVQLTLDQARKPHGRGGWRPGAGRPKGRTRVGHVTRPEISPAHPQHVTLRIVSDLPSLRRGCFVKTIREAIARSHRAGFRIVHFNVEPNHLHLITEASSKEAHGRGMQGFEVRMSRQLNKQLGRTGSLFEDRYHSRSLKSPREVRNALRYVLNNARHHAAERGETIGANWIDPYSSAAWFDGWQEAIVVDASWKRYLLSMTPPTAKATAWLLTTGWRKHGAIRFDEIPGAFRNGAIAFRQANDSQI